MKAYDPIAAVNNRLNELDAIFVEEGGSAHYFDALDDLLVLGDRFPETQPLIRAAGYNVDFEPSPSSHQANGVAYYAPGR